MIENLPLELPFRKLTKFEFGDPEGKTDELLDDPRCITLNHCYSGLINNNKRSFIVGEIGSGKSALIKLLLNRKIKFLNQNENLIFLILEDDLDYKTIKNSINKQVNNSFNDEVYNARIIWEIFILYRILLEIEKKFRNLPDKLKKIIAYFKEVLGEGTKKLSLTEFLSSLKVEFGVKYNTVSSTITPHISFEPSAASKSINRMQMLAVNDIKEEINRFLKRKKYKLYVLIDKLDEFRISNEYENQKLILQGLVESERSYLDIGNIKIKLFIRKDLFDQIDFQKIGYDKILGNIFFLEWNHDDIRDFIAKRIIYNYMENLGLKKLIWRYDQTELESEKKDKHTVGHDIKRIPVSEKFLNRMLDDFSKGDSLFYRIRQTVNGILGRNRSREHFIDSKDLFNIHIINSLFPRNIEHKNKHGQIETIATIKFFETHFSLASGKTNPRTILLFLQVCLDKTVDYYLKNPEKLIFKNSDGEYPLIKKSVFYASYRKFQSLMIDVIAHTSEKFQQQFYQLQVRRKKAYSFSYKEIKSMLSFKNEEELQSFITFFSHIGYLKCNNPMNERTVRNYELPILFRHTKMVDI